MLIRVFHFAYIHSLLITQLFFHSKNAVPDLEHSVFTIFIKD